MSPSLAGAVRRAFLAGLVALPMVALACAEDVRYRPGGDAGNGPGGSTAQMVFVHAVPNLAPVDILLDGGAVAVADLPFANISSQTTVPLVDNGVHVRPQGGDSFIETGIHFAPNAAELFVVLLPNRNDAVVLVDIENDVTASAEDVTAVVVVNGTDQVLDRFLVADEQLEPIWRETRVGPFEVAEPLLVDSPSGELDVGADFGGVMVNFDLPFVPAGSTIHVYLIGRPEALPDAGGALSCWVHKLHLESTLFEAERINN